METKYIHIEYSIFAYINLKSKLCHALVIMHVCYRRVLFYNQLVLPKTLNTPNWDWLLYSQSISSINATFMYILHCK